MPPIARPSSSPPSSPSLSSSRWWKWWFRKRPGPAYSQLAVEDDNEALPPRESSSTPPASSSSSRSLSTALALFLSLLIVSVLIVFRIAQSTAAGLQPLSSTTTFSPTTISTASLATIPPPPPPPPTSTSNLLFITAASPYTLHRACAAARALPVVRTPFRSLNELAASFTSDTTTTVCGVLDYRVGGAGSWQEDLLQQHGIQVRAHGDPVAPWQAVFDPWFTNWTRPLVDLELEAEIDESCLRRRHREMRKANCDVLDIGLVRAALLFVRLRAHQAGGDGDIIPATPANNARATRRIKPLLHRALLVQLQEILSNGNDDKPPIPPPARLIVPEQRVKPMIDAGSCAVVEAASTPFSDTAATTTTEAAAAKARCLPTYMVIGAQKSGTDELSVYLNRNTQHARRMDGGQEVHFFDCVGRGVGHLDEDRDVFRLSCGRARTSLMYASSVASSARAAQEQFTWRQVNQHSPFVDELALPFYQKLGQITSKQYTKEHRALVFEKSPSYLDLADPRDVARVLPRGKFVFLSRDPVPRLVSAYFQYCEAYDTASSPVEQKRDAQNCTMAEFAELARQLVTDELDLVTRDEGLPRRLAFHRGAQYGKYVDFLNKWLEYFWVADKMEEKQFLLVDNSHFKQHPKAVLYAVESFVGLRGVRHYDYTPKMRDGRYAYGESSKASHPTHPGRGELPKDVELLLRAYYKPSVDALRELLLRPRCPIVFGLMYDTFPPELMSAPHPLSIFNGTNRFQLPEWLKP